MMHMQRPSDCTGLILSGGGARAAYQVGVLSVIAELLPAGASNPFPVICGTSAGAINAVALARRQRTGMAVGTGQPAWGAQQATDGLT